MNLLSSFIINRLLKALEDEFQSHLPELQQAFLNEVSLLVKKVSDWVESKINAQGGSVNEEKVSK